MASVLMQRRSYPTEAVLSNKITRNRIALSFKDSPRKRLGRRPDIVLCTVGSTESLKKVFPRLRDPASCRRLFTQLRKSLLEGYNQLYRLDGVDVAQETETN